MNNRNKPCACGSGLKTKRCCGDEAALCKKRRDEALAWVQKAREERRFRPRRQSSLFLAAAMLNWRYIR